MSPVLVLCGRVACCRGCRKDEEEEDEEVGEGGGKGVWLKTLKSCCLIEFAFASSMPRFFGLRRTTEDQRRTRTCNDARRASQDSKDEQRTTRTCKNERAWKGWRGLCACRETLRKGSWGGARVPPWPFSSSGGCQRVLRGAPSGALGDSTSTLSTERHQLRPEGA